MNPIEWFFTVSMAIAAAAGFIFLWHRWNVSRSPLSLVLAIGITVLIAIAIAFSMATIILHLLSL